MAFSLASITKKIVNTLITIVKIAIPFPVAPSPHLQTIAYTPLTPTYIAMPPIASLDDDRDEDNDILEAIHEGEEDVIPENTHAKLLFAHAKALIAAAQNSDTAAGIELITTGAPVNVRDSAGNSPLKAAIQTDNVELILALIQAGAYIPEATLKATQKNTPHSAQNNTAFMPHKSWMDQALFAAIQYKNTQAIKVLIQANANVNITDSKGNTPLLLAVCQDDFFSVDILIKAGANLNAQNAAGKTALMLATRHAHHHTQKEIVFRLLSALPNLHSMPIHSNPLNTMLRQYKQKIMQIRSEVFSVIGALGIINKNQPVLPRVLMSMVLSHSDLYPRWYQSHIQQDMRNVTKIVNKIIQTRQKKMLLLRDARPKAIKRKMLIDNAENVNGAVSKKRRCS
jgi:hypothetical protein